MDFVAVVPPAGRPYIRTREYGDPAPPEGTPAYLSRGELIALEHFEAKRLFFQILAERGVELAERFADELHLRLAIMDPRFRDIARDTVGDDALLTDALTAAEAFPDPVCRQQPLPDQFRIVLRDGHAVAYSTYGPEAREPAAVDRPLMVQIPAVVWELLRQELQLEEEVLARVEAGGGASVAELIEGFVERLYVEDRLDEPLAVRVYSSYGAQAEHIITGEDDPVPTRWTERRRQSEERIRELERRYGTETPGG